MFEEIRIRGLGVIEDAELALGPGLTVVTGETGAGKTMVVTGLSLLLGERADPGLVRPGVDRAVVEGIVRVPPESPAASRAAEAGAELDDDTLILRRTVSAEGRSRANVGGASVPVKVLAAVGEDLVAVHGQSEQLRLLRPVRQREVLDRYGGEVVASAATAYHNCYERLRAVETELAELVTRARERAQEADLLRFGLGEIEAVAPQPGEDEDLLAEEERLAHADSLRGAADEARTALAGTEDATDGAGGAGADALAAIAAARKALEAVRAHDTELGALSDRVAEASFLLSDAAADLASYATSIETDPARLQTIGERRAALGSLTRKYGETVAEVLRWADNARMRLAELDGSDDRITELRALQETTRAELGELAGALSQARSEAAERFGAAVSAELAALAMPNADLSVDVRQQEVDSTVPNASTHPKSNTGEDAAETDAGHSARSNPNNAAATRDSQHAGADQDTTAAEATDPDGLDVDGRRLAYGAHGVDEVELLLRPHAGAPPRPVQRGASGGELSRIMLGVEVVFAGADSVPTFVFDEVDAGVGGRAAVEVGRRLAKLAAGAQVLVVTHLAQVAAFADRHYVVRKSDDGSITRSGLTLLDSDERVEELARMLAGLDDSSSARAHAEELLATAAQARSDFAQNSRSRGKGRRRR